MNKLKIKKLTLQSELGRMFWRRSTLSITQEEKIKNGERSSREEKYKHN